MDLHLLTLAEWRALLQSPEEQQRRGGQLLLGTIMDVLQIAEGCKKDQEVLDVAKFRAGWEALREREGLLDDGTLQLVGLDREELLHALFDWERKRGDEGFSLWEPAADRGPPPWRTMRRLMLRPTEHRWLWDQDVYDAMERMFEEEPGGNG